MRMLKFVAVAICAWVWFACASAGVASAQCPCNQQGQRQRWTPIRNAVTNIRDRLGYHHATTYPAPAIRSSSCVCGDSCACPAGTCPAKCPVSSPVQLTTPRQIIGYTTVCDGQRCYRVPVYDR